MLHEIIQFNPVDKKQHAVYLGHNEQTQRYHVQVINADGEVIKDFDYINLPVALMELAYKMGSGKYIVNG